MRYCLLSYTGAFVYPRHCHSRGNMKTRPGRALESLMRNPKVFNYSNTSGKIHAISWNASGSRLASGSTEGGAYCFRFDTSAGLIREEAFAAHEGSVEQIAWHPRDNEVFCTAGSDCVLRLWDCRTPSTSRRYIAKINLKGDNLNLAWSPDGHCIAVANKDDVLTWYDLRTMTSRHEEHFKYEVNEFAWNPECTAFFLTSGTGHIHILSYPDLKLVYSRKAHPVSVVCLKFDPTGRHFAIGASDASASIWDSSQIICKRSLNRLDWPIRAIGFSHDGSLIACGSEDHFIDIADVATGEQVVQLNNAGSPTLVLDWHPRHPCLAYCLEEKHDKGIRLFGLPRD